VVVLGLARAVDAELARCCGEKSLRMRAAQAQQRPLWLKSRLRSQRFVGWVGLIAS
jgi:hypothetical protein